jgi:hypothetical protein
MKTLPRDSGWGGVLVLYEAGKRGGRNQGQLAPPDRLPISFIRKRALPYTLIRSLFNPISFLSSHQEVWPTPSATQQLCQADQKGEGAKKN